MSHALQQFFAAPSTVYTMIESLYAVHHECMQGDPTTPGLYRIAPLLMILIFIWLLHRSRRR